MQNSIFLRIVCKIQILTLRAPRGAGGGVENDPHQGLSSVVFARGMISERNFGLSNFNYFQVGGKIKFKTLPKILVGERCNNEGMDGNLLQNIVF